MLKLIKTRRPKLKLDFYPFDYGGLLVRKDNKAVVETDLGHLCGYVAFYKDSIPREWNSHDADALQYLSIHGGITFCEEPNEYVIVFGFDCMHAGDEKNPYLKDPRYVMELVEDMELLLVEYAKWIKFWRVLDKYSRVWIIDKVNHKTRSQSWGFGAMIGMLSGVSEFDNESIVAKFLEFVRVLHKKISGGETNGSRSNSRRPKD